MARKTIPLQLTEDQRSELLLWERKPTTPQIVLHFTPASFSWMNLVERFFRDITQDFAREVLEAFKNCCAREAMAKIIFSYIANTTLVMTNRVLVIISRETLSTPVGYLLGVQKYFFR
jgi:hypothetical protein